MSDFAAALHGRVPLPAGTVLAKGWLSLGPVVGVGAGGIIYSATEPGGLTVAVKEVMPVGCSRSGSRVVTTSRALKKALNHAVSHAKNESDILDRVDHPGIMKTLGLFEENSTVYQVVELLRGQSLLSMSGTGVTVEQLVFFGAQVADALSALHEEGAIHGDIKPENIFVQNTHPPQATLIDFGAAFFFKDTLVGQTREMTRGYAAPEQYMSSGEPEGPRTDIYSLCATMYHLLTGHLPPESAKLRRKHGFPSLKERRPTDISDQYSAAIQSGLSIDPIRRPADADTLCALMGVELEPWAAPKLELAWQEDCRATPVRCVTLSGDGRVLASAVQNGWVTCAPIDGSQRHRRIRMGDRISCIALSHYSDQIVVGSPTGAAGFNIQGQALHQYVTGQRVGSLDYCYDNSRLAIGLVDGSVSLVTTQTGEIVQLTQGHSTLVGAVTFTLDCQTLASAAYEGTICIWRLADHQLLLSLPSQNQILYDLQFSPDGKMLASASGDGNARVFLTATGSNVRSFRCGGKPVRGVAFSPDSSKLALASESGVLALYDLASGRKIGVTEVEKKLVGVEWSAHGLACVAEGSFYRGWKV